MTLLSMACWHQRFTAILYSGLREPWATEMLHRVRQLCSVEDWKGRNRMEGEFHPHWPWKKNISTCLRTAPRKVLGSMLPTVFWGSGTHRWKLRGSEGSLATSLHETEGKMYPLYRPQITPSPRQLIIHSIRRPLHMTLRTINLPLLREKENKRNACYHSDTATP